MGINERKERQRAEREKRIVAAARQVAEQDGWGAVTIRRLADEIEHSQPVLYAHFENRDAIVAAVAVDGFRELTTSLRDAARSAANPRQALEAVSFAYLAFARHHPAVYEAMFSLPTVLRFAVSATRPELRDAFQALAAVVPRSGPDPDLATETYWATLHGLSELERSGRIRLSARAERIGLVVSALLGCDV